MDSPKGPGTLSFSAVSMSAKPEGMDAQVQLASFKSRRVRKQARLVRLPLRAGSQVLDCRERSGGDMATRSTRKPGLAAWSHPIHRGPTMLLHNAWEAPNPGQLEVEEGRPSRLKKKTDPSPISHEIGSPGRQREVSATREDRQEPFK